MHLHPLNPFLYGKPVPPSRFVGRQALLRTVFSRMNHGDSTALLGLPHFGKSSVLRYVDSPQVRRAWLGAAAELMQIVQIDCHVLESSARPSDFWRLVIDAIFHSWAHEPAVRQAAAAAHTAGYSPTAMTRLFGQSLGEQGRRVALLLDEVEVLLHHPNFRCAEFLGLLRSLSTRTDGMVLLLASHLSLSQMNRLSAEVNFGSPFFNNCIEVPMSPLSAAEIELLIDTSLAPHESAFDPADRAFVIDQSGGQPYLVQATAAALFDVITEEKSAGAGRYERAAAVLHKQVASYFDAIWQHLEGPLRQALLRQALLAGSDAGPEGAAAAAAPCKTELQQLRQFGLLVSRPDHAGPAVPYSGEALATSLATWVIGHAAAVAGSPSPGLWERWLGAAAELDQECELLRTWVLRTSPAAAPLPALLSLPQSAPPPRALPAQAGRGPTRGSMRQVLLKLLPTASELDRFCLDHFKAEVFDRFSSGMDRTSRINLLLEAIEPGLVLEQLAGAFPERIDKYRPLLRWQ